MESRNCSDSLHIHLCLICVCDMVLKKELALIYHRTRFVFISRRKFFFLGFVWRNLPEEWVSAHKKRKYTVFFPGKFSHLFFSPNKWGYLHARKVSYRTSVARPGVFTQLRQFGVEQAHVGLTIVTFPGPKALEAHVCNKTHKHFRNKLENLPKGMMRLVRKSILVQNKY